jgi:hypothetical protein
MNRYDLIQEYKTIDGVRYKRNPIYPDIPEHEDDFYVITTGGDRYDTLALQYYKDSSLWWIIASANTYSRYNLIPTPGVQLRIPHDKDSIILSFQKVNRER